MTLYRVFPALASAGERDPGGPLFVARERQGGGRHDNPELYGALYASRHEASAVGERIQAFRGGRLPPGVLRRPDGSALALAAYDDDALGPIVDLDDGAVLASRGLRPSQVASRRRTVTQPIARRAFEDGADGISWWSVLDADWTNVTLFAERVGERLRLAGPVRLLSLDDPALRAAADALGVALS